MFCLCCESEFLLYGGCDPRYGPMIHVALLEKAFPRGTDRSQPELTLGDVRIYSDLEIV